ncbi:MAG: GNVR domain-containing protein [Gemmatimonadales bacterium]
MTHAPSLPSEPPAVLPLVNALLRQRRLLLLLPLSLAVLVVAVGLVLPRSYTAGASFAPQSAGGSLSSLTGLAAQFGIAVPTDDAANSPDFYADLLRSGQLLRKMVDSAYVYVDHADTVRATLVQVYEIDESTPERSREKAVKRLGQQMQISTDLKTGVVTVAVQAPAADLAEQLTRYALDLVNGFNLRTRQTRATAERQFVEGRVAEAQQELREAENRLQAFLTTNRTFDNAPQLQFQHDRLQRDVGMRQDVYTKLVQAYEQTRIDEVRNTPVITIVEAPIRPVRPDSRRLALKALLALFIGGFFGILLALFRQALARTSDESPNQYAEFVRLRTAFVAELKHPWMLVRSQSNGE